MTKELIDPKHRWFIWTIIIILVVGSSLIGYAYLTGLELESVPIVSSVLAKKGTIKVYSEPTGAKIFLDDQDTGKVTDAEIRAKVGTHTLKLTKEGYKDAVLEVKVEKNQITEVKATLEKGEISITPPVNWKTYTNTKYGFSFKYPNNAKLEDETVKSGFESGFGIKITLTSKSPVTGEGMEEFNVINIGISKPYNKDATIKEIVENEFKELLIDPTTLKNKYEFYIAGKPAYRWDYEQVKELISRSIRIKVNEELILALNLDYVTSETNLILDGILSTFKFTK